MPRPSVDIIVPCAGPADRLRAVAGRLAALDLQPGDTATVVDNRPVAEATPVVAEPPIAVLRAHERQSSYVARNRGAEAGGAEWLVFLDDDVRFDAGLLDAFFGPGPDERDAVLAGGIVDVAVGDGVVARWLVDRAAMSQDITLGRDRAYAQTANCAVRRTAFMEVGGFDESIRSGGDADLCFRLADAGWVVASRPAARVRHDARTRVPGLLGQIARHGAGAAWLDERHPGSFPREQTWPGLTSWALRGIARAARLAARGDRDGAGRALLAPAIAWAFELGRHLPNEAPRAGQGRLDRLLR